MFVFYIIRNFVKYSLNPVLRTPASFPVWKCLYAIGVIYIFVFIFKTLSAFVSAKVCQIIGVEIVKSFPQNLLFWQIIITGVVILPLIEEIGFRLPILFKPINLTLSVMVFVYYFFTIVVYKTRNADIQNGLWIRVGIALLIGIAVFFLLKQYKHYLSNFWQRNFKILYYSVVMFFAFVHILNYNASGVQYVFIPVIVFPQLIYGLMLNYVRIHFGFFYGYFAHAANNFFVLSFLYMDKL